MRSGSAGYWAGVAGAWEGSGRDALWRAHSDAVHGALLERWLPHGRVRRVLKTDLFDEVVSEGLVPQLARRAGVVVGMDVAWPAARAARARQPSLAALTSDVRHLPFGDGAFDSIISNSTLDHFPSRRDLAAALRELRRVLARDGELILSLDNLANPVIALRNALPCALARRTGLVPYYVGATCGPRGLRRTLEECGFRVIEMCAIAHAPRVLAMPLLRLAERRAGCAMRRRLLRGVLACERAARWPTRYLTGHFVAVRAVHAPLAETHPTARVPDRVPEHVRAAPAAAVPVASDFPR